MSLFGILLFIGGVVYVRMIVNQPDQLKVVQQQTPEPPQSAPRPVERNVVVPDQPQVVASDNGPRVGKGVERPARPRKTPLVAVDMGSERPPVISDSQRQSPIFQIDASLQSLRFSFDDGRGNARTISFPSVSFGSQRLLTNANQFNPKGVW